MKMKAAKELKTFGAVKVFNIRCVSLGVRRELYTRVLAPTVTRGAEAYGMRMNERHTLHVEKDSFLRSMGGVTRMV